MPLADAPEGTVVTTHVCDVSDEASQLAFRDAVVAQHQTDHVNLLFNNAGIGGGGSVITDPREVWERTFNVCWGGVYLGVRTFLPLVIASDEGHIVNTSSVNGFWASIGPDRPHTAYSAAKFAVKGFSEALITDLRVNAPHVKVSVVMPGHIGTSIVENSMRHGAHELDMETAEMVQADVRHVPRPGADDRRRGEYGDPRRRPRGPVADPRRRRRPQSRPRGARQPRDRLRVVDARRPHLLPGGHALQPGRLTNAVSDARIRRVHRSQHDGGLAAPSREP